MTQAKIWENNLYPLGESEFMLATSMINNKIRFYFRNMKLDSTLKINVSALKQALIDAGSDYSVNDIKADLQSIGATVEGAKEDGLVYMYISGDVDVEDIETAFDEANVDVNEFVVNGDLSECDGMNDTNECDDTFECDEDDTFEYDGENLDECGIPEFDEVDECDDTFECNEKKQDCCPKKKVVNEADKISEIRKIRRNDQKQSNVLIPLKEALRGDVKKTRKEDVPSLNGLIDHICGKRNSKTVNEAAINKARAERGEAMNEGLEFLKEKLGAKLYNQILVAMSNNKKSLHENISINKKKLVDYTLDELKSIFEKITSQVEELKNKSTEGLNEKDSAMIQQKLTTKERLAQILSEEISYRQAITEDDDFAGLDNMNLDPNKESGDDTEKEEKTDDKENDNPDEDEEEEIGSIVITLASKEAAEELKSDLIDAEIPEDVIEIAPVESDDEESEDEESEESEETSEESSDEASEEKTEESVSYKGTKLNEEDETSDEEESTDEENNEEDAEETSEEEEEGAYKLILTDTDYAKNLRDTLELKWGLTKDEFADMIGGEIVDDENSEETSDEESSDSEKSEEDEDKEIEDEFNPDEIFKGI